MNDMGASAEPAGLGAPDEGAEPPSRLGASPAIPSAAANTDRELWREEDDYYAPSIHVTAHGAIGINVGGRVYVKTVQEWHALAEYEDDEAHATRQSAWREHDGSKQSPVPEDTLIGDCQMRPDCGGIIKGPPIPAKSIYWSGVKRYRVASDLRDSSRLPKGENAEGG
jgi:hypothetical protein